MNNINQKHEFQKNWIALRGIIAQELKRVLRIWRQTLIPPIINITLYFLVFGNFIGSKIPSIQGYSYMAFLTPGLIMMAIIMEAYNGSVFPFFINKFHRNIEEILVAPVPSAIILLGFTLSSIIRSLSVGLLTAIIAFIFFPIAPQHLGILLIAAILASTLFAFIGFTNAVFAKSFEDTSVVPTFILTPLVYLGGVFYSVEQLPSFWQKIAMLNPITYIIDIFRYGFLGTQGHSSLASLALLSLLIIMAYLFNIHLLNKGTRLKS